MKNEMQCPVIERVTSVLRRSPLQRFYPLSPAGDGA